MTDKLIIFDTTLRDGEQSPGASMTREEKLRIARQLERMKVDVMEAGFAASSNGDFEAIKAIADVIKDSTVCSLARANDRDISRAAEALKGANAWRIHTFIATSPLHMEKKLRMSPEEVLEQAKRSVRFARNLTSDVEFSAEDGYRSEIDFLARVCEAVIAEGATTINIPDTVGYGVPELYGNFIKTLREKVPNSDKAIWSVHCHNDLGMAVANSLAGVKIGGARQVECTINGLGERAGNCSLEEIAMVLKVRQAFYGEEVQRLQRGRDEVRVYVRYPRDERRSLQNLSDMRIRTPDGAEIPFSEVVAAEEGRGYAPRALRVEIHRSFEPSVPGRSLATTSASPSADTSSPSAARIAVSQRARHASCRSSAGAGALSNRGRNSQAPNSINTTLKCTKRHSTSASLMNYWPTLNW